MLVIDKPADMTSARVVAQLKRALGADKVGHTGTLDPFATGVLVCCVNQATRLARFFLSGNKTYLATLRLGVETDTQDLTGRVIRTGETDNLTETAVLNAVKQFKGDMLQTPPVYSALKHCGTPLYKLARSGNPVEKPARPVRITDLEVTRMVLPEVCFSVSCSAGTYIRTLCSDIGRVLGCGGHLTALRRVESGGFTLSESLGLDETADIAAAGNAGSYLIPMAEALRGIPAHGADRGLVERVRQGRPLTRQDFRPELDVQSGNYIKIVDTHYHLLAVLQVDGEAFQYCCVFPEEAAINRD